MVSEENYTNGINWGRTRSSYKINRWARPPSINAWRSLFEKHVTFKSSVHATWTRS